jgi:hypothetical protein
MKPPYSVAEDEVTVTSERVRYCYLVRKKVPPDLPQLFSKVVPVKNAVDSSRYMAPPCSAALFANTLPVSLIDVLISDSLNTLPLTAVWHYSNLLLVDVTVSANFSSINDPLLTVPTVAGAVDGSSQIIVQVDSEKVMSGLIELMKEPEVPALMFLRPSRQFERVKLSN